MPKKQKGSQKHLSASNIRVREPVTRRRLPRQHSASKIVPDQLVGGFFDFLRSHAIVGLAVGFVIGTQVQTLVKQLVSSFITPTFQLFFSGNLAKDTLSWHIRGHSTSFAWGIFASDLLDFLFVVAAIYLLIRFLRLEKLDEPKAK